MPLEEWDHRQKDLKSTLKGIFDTLVDCRKLLDDMMHIWTSLQEDPNIQKIEEELQVKQNQCDEILEVVKILLVLQILTDITEGKNLQKKIDELQRKENILQERTQPWQDEVLKLYQVVDDRLKELNKREVEILQKAVGLTIEELLEQTHKHEKQLAETVQQYNVICNEIATKIKGTKAE